MEESWNKLEHKQMENGTVLVILTVLEKVLKQDFFYVIDSQYPQWDLIT